MPPRQIWFRRRLGCRRWWHSLGRRLDLRLNAFLKAPRRVVRRHIQSRLEFGVGRSKAQLAETVRGENPFSREAASDAVAVGINQYATAQGCFRGKRDNASQENPNVDQALHRLAWIVVALGLGEPFRTVQ